MTDAASILYGASPTPTTPSVVVPPQGGEPQPEPEQTETLADDLPPDNTVAEKAQSIQDVTTESIRSSIPEDILAAREADPLRKLYSPQVEFEQGIADDAFSSIPGISTEAAKAIAVEVREMAGDMGMQSADIQIFRDALTRANEPLSEEQRIQNREKAVEMFNREFGNGALQAFNDARRFVAADPRRERIISMIGDDPAVCLRVAQLARAAKAAGRLK